MIVVGPENFVLLGQSGVTFSKVDISPENDVSTKL